MTPKYPIGTWVVEHATATVCQVVAIETTATDRPSYSLSSGSAGLHEHELDEIIRVHRCDVYAFCQQSQQPHRSVFFAVTNDESLPIGVDIAAAIQCEIKAASLPSEAPPF
ncbi:MAG: hypothetical protein E6Q97_01765 [Desulfurellales bacterium]|nr:MAG: hypothetical protein E6Q97_01765 [Desulfurellales bacterium]